MQNIPLWHKNYFEPKTLENQQILSRKALSEHYPPYLPESRGFQK